MFTLECAVIKREFFALLLAVLPTQQAENQLRLLCALLDFKRDDGGGGGAGAGAGRKARARKIASLYLVQGAAFEVEALPSHIVKLELEDSCESIKHVLLGELVKLREVLAVLESETVPDTTTEQKEQLREISDRYAAACSVCEATAPGLGGSELALIGKLEQLVANPHTRRDLVVRTLACDNAGLGVRLRFVAAVDQFLASTNEPERRKLGSKIRDLFICGGGMFSIDMPEGLSRAILHQGNLNALEDARLQVLCELCADQQLAQIVLAQEPM